jgi:hypothetical protein
MPRDRSYDDLKDMCPRTVMLVAEADGLKDSGLDTPAKLARFAALMFEAGYSQCQADTMKLIRSRKPGC